MGLKLKLKPSESVYLAGALIRNAGSSGTVLELMNEVPMLREKDILLEREAATPCQKLYLIVQTLYFEAAARETLFEAFQSLLTDIVVAAPSLKVYLDAAMASVRAEEYYAALKTLQKAIIHETKLIVNAKQSN